MTKLSDEELQEMRQLGMTDWGLKNPLSTWVIFQDLLDHIAALEGENARLRDGDPCARECEGMAYRIDSRMQRQRAEKAEAELKKETELKNAYYNEAHEGWRKFRHAEANREATLEHICAAIIDLGFATGHADTIREAVDEWAAQCKELKAERDELRCRPYLDITKPNCHEAADAFWDYWRENGETHKHGYYESTWGAINAALQCVGVTTGCGKEGG